MRHRALPNLDSISLWTLLIGLLVAGIPVGAQPEEELIRLFQEDRTFATVPESLFNQLGWDLPDGGRSVQELGEQAPQGAFDPRNLEAIPSHLLGYQPKWHQVRFNLYNLDWDIGGLHLMPNDPIPGLPTLVILHGGSANWYEFFVDPFNQAGLGQYLAQKIPVLLLTIPGNYRHGGWTEVSHVNRIPGYLLDREISRHEAQIRNAVFTFRVVVEGVRQIIEKATSGPVVVIGHSTGGEVPFLLMETSLKSRMQGLYLGWGSGGPARLDKVLNTPEEHRESARRRFSQYEPIHILRSRSAGEYAYNSTYIGPLNPCKGADKLEVAECWFRQEQRRRPAFKQKLQDLEHGGADPLLEVTAAEIRAALDGNQLGVNAEAVIRDLFSTNQAPLTGYRKMLWLVGKLDSHARIRDGIVSEARVANQFRKENPQATIRVGLFDAPITHFGHIEQPRQLAGGLLAGLKWLVKP